MNKKTKNKEQLKQESSIRRSLGSLLRARRRELGFTLEELARRSGLSAAFLSQAERGRATPSIVSIVNIASALETDINYFLTPPSPTSMVRRADKPNRITLASPVEYIRLDTPISNQLMNAILMKIPPGIELPSVHRAEGEDFFYVIEGELEMTIGKETFTLAPGDSVHLNSQVDHNAVNCGRNTATAIWVGTPVIFPTAKPK